MLNPKFLKEGKNSLKEAASNIMINVQKLRHLSCICAYCNKVIPMNERTNDHIIPRCAGGITEIGNIAICCPDCNSQKGSMEVNTFLEIYKDKADCFYNYLNMIDYQMGNNDYSSAVIDKLSESLKNTYLRKKSKKRAKRLRYKKNKENRETIIQNKYNETQDIEYNFELSGKRFYINELQSKILDYYIEHPDFSDYKKLADELKIGKTRFLREICCINNLTGIFKIKKMSENGIILNDLICNDIQNKITKSEDKQICESFLPSIDAKSEILILGSMPGVKSLEEQQYYAHQNNRFWKLTGMFCNTQNLQEMNYQDKLKVLLKNKIALWDVIESCSREGSLDSDIKNETPNNILNLLKRYPNIKGIILNGSKAYSALKKYFPELLKQYQCYKLPSTSPANAKYKLENLYEEWQTAAAEIINSADYNKTVN